MDDCCGNDDAAWALVRTVQEALPGRAGRSAMYR
jgi:hypothetical protein